MTANEHHPTEAALSRESLAAAAETERLVLSAGQQPYAFIAEFAGVDALAEAAERTRDADYTYWDVHCPMPIHGLSAKMGLRPTILPWISLVHGVAGMLFGLAMVWWINAYNAPWTFVPFQGYDYIVSGKPKFSLPANVAVIFETTVLFTAIGTILGMCGLNRLPMLHNPLLKSDRFRRATSDGLLLVIEATDPNFDLNGTHEFLKSLRPLSIELLVEENETRT
jgi:hypothetical protein